MPASLSPIESTAHGLAAWIIELPYRDKDDATFIRLQHGEARLCICATRSANARTNSKEICFDPASLKRFSVLRNIADDLEGAAGNSIKVLFYISNWGRTSEDAIGLCQYTVAILSNATEMVAQWNHATNDATEVVARPEELHL